MFRKTYHSSSVFDIICSAKNIAPKMIAFVHTWLFLSSVVSLRTSFFAF